VSQPEPSDVDSEEPIGIFPTWKSLYITVVIYALGLIGLLAYLTVRLDFS